MNIAITSFRVNKGELQNYFLEVALATPPQTLGAGLT